MNGSLGKNGENPWLILGKVSITPPPPFYEEKKYLFQVSLTGCGIYLGQARDASFLGNNLLLCSN